MASRPSPLLDLWPAAARARVGLFSWAIPTDAALELLSKYAPLAECGAGMGYWLALLRARGVDAIGYDLSRPGAEERLSPQRPAAVDGNSTSIFRESGEAPPGSHPGPVLAALRRRRGELPGSARVSRRRGHPYRRAREGATGSVRFHRELALNWTLAEELELPHWPRLQDRVMVHRRNPQRRPHLERDRCFECKKLHSHRRHRALRRLLPAAPAGARAPGRKAPRRVSLKRGGGDVARAAQGLRSEPRPNPLTPQLQCARSLYAASVPFAQRSSSGSYTSGRM